MLMSQKLASEHSVKLNRFKSLPKPLSKATLPKLSPPKQPTPLVLPKLEHNFNQWYIPYTKRFVKAKRQRNFTEQIEESNSLLKNNDMFHSQNYMPKRNMDPFKLTNDDIEDKLQQCAKLQRLTERNRKNLILKDYIKFLISKKNRMPYFMQNS